ncbi:hypothetical protein E2C01_064442 [Portunus trituberculatus]|uniref:Uncharacterized protein n=1 Tax=Portunus trituberculatus TaxID=210409 RepID=A0A5B7HD12_PORTR|nr:hypothetical protein [Portunus trituberculatus]
MGTGGGTCGVVDRRGGSGARRGQAGSRLAHSVSLAQRLVQYSHVGRKSQRGTGRCSAGVSAMLTLTAAKKVGSQASELHSSCHFNGAASLYFTRPY